MMYYLLVCCIIMSTALRDWSNSYIESHSNTAAALHNGSEFQMELEQDHLYLILLRQVRLEVKSYNLNENYLVNRGLKKTT